MKKTIQFAILTLALASIGGLSLAQPLPVFGPQTFERTDGEIDVYTEVFNLDHGGDFALIVRNGDGETGQVSSAIVILNGETLVDLPDLSENINGLKRPVQLPPGESELTVELEGEPGSFVTIALVRRGDRPVFIHGRLILPWARSDGERGLSLALKNGSARFSRKVRLIFFSPDGRVQAKSERIELAPRASLAVNLEQILAETAWEVGSVEVIFAGVGSGRLFGSARQTTAEHADIQILQSAGHHVFRGNDKVR